MGDRLSYGVTSRCCAVTTRHGKPFCHETSSFHYKSLCHGVLYSHDLASCQAMSCIHAVPPWRMTRLRLTFWHPAITRNRCLIHRPVVVALGFATGSSAVPCLRSFVCHHSRTYHPVSAWCRFMTCPPAMSFHQVMLCAILSLYVLV